MTKGFRSKRRVSGNKGNPIVSSLASGQVETFLRKPVVHILIIVIAGFLIYSNTFKAPFIFDDEDSIVNNPAIKDIRLFIDPARAEKDGRFIGFLTFALNYKMHALDVTGYHVFNLLIHLMNALLVYWLVVLTFRTPYASDYVQRDIFKPSDVRHQIALFTGLLFVSHPIQTQAVTYIVQRFASLATLFYLFSLVMYIKARGSESSNKARYAFYAASILSTLLAMRTKEITFTLPVMIILYEWMFFKGIIKRRLLYLLPFLLTMPIIPLTWMGMPIIPSMRTGSEGLLSPFIRFEEITRMAVILSRWDYLNTEFRVIVTYIRLLFFPAHQNLDYDYPIYRTFFNPEVVISFLFLLALFGLGVYLFYASTRVEKGNRFWLRLVSLGILWFFVTLSPESSIVPVWDVIYEHRLYLPSVGFFMALMSGIVFIRAWLGSRTKMVEKAFMPAMIFVVIGLSATAYARNTVWQDGVTLWEDVIKKSPNKVRPYSHLGGFYLKQGRMNEAIAAYQAAIIRKPDNAEAHNNLGIVYRKQGRFDDAVQEIRTALKYGGPGYAEAHSNLGRVYYDQGRFDDAIKEYQTALKYKPNDAEAHNNLGVLYQNQGRFDDAVQEIRTALKYGPDYAEAHSNLGRVYYDQGRFDDAIKEYQTALKIKPNDAEAHNSLGVLYRKQGRFDDAIKEIQMALMHKPDYADGYYNLGTVYINMGKLDEAKASLLKAVDLSPSHVTAHNNLGTVYAMQKQYEEAYREFQAVLKIDTNNKDARYNIKILQKEMKKR